MLAQLKIYGSAENISFNFKTSLDKIYNNLFASLDKVIVINNNLLLTDEQRKMDALYGYQEQSIIKIKAHNYKFTGIRPEQFYFAKLVTTVAPQKMINNAQVINQFLIELFKEQLVWAEHYLFSIHEHLENRESEGKKLTNHDSVRLLVGKTVSCIEIIKAIFTTINFHNKDVLNFISHQMIEICNNCAKLAGGRAFVSGGVLEMLITFQFINQHYLSEKLV